MLEMLAEKRLQYGRPVIIDATNTRGKIRQRWLDLAEKHTVPILAMRFDVPIDVCKARQDERARKVPEYVIERQFKALENIEHQLLNEPWHGIFVHDGQKTRALRPWSMPKRHEIDDHGHRYLHTHIDFVGDVHGCMDELEQLLAKMGWEAEDNGLWQHPEDRLLVFVGDLVDRGPKSVPVVQFVAQMVKAERAALVMGNHDDKFKRYLLGNGVNLDSAIQTTIEECEAMSPEDKDDFVDQALELFINAPLWAAFAPATSDRFGLSAHVIVAHAAWTPSLVGQKRDRVRFYCLYGPNTGEKDASGYPERLDWRMDYPEDAPLCVTGHTPFAGQPRKHHNTLCIDTGCVFGHRLTAWRFPEDEIVSVDAIECYSDHKKLLEYPDLLPMDVYRKRKAERQKGS